MNLARISKERLGIQHTSESQLARCKTNDEDLLPTMTQTKKDRVHHCSRPPKKLESYKKIKLFICCSEFLFQSYGLLPRNINGSYCSALLLCNDLLTLFNSLHIQRNQVVITLGKGLE